MGITSGGQYYGGDGSGSFLGYFHRFVYETDQFNPVALLWDGIKGNVNGTDRYGNALSGFDANLKIVSAIPVAKAASIVTNTARGVLITEARIATSGAASALKANPFKGKTFSQVDEMFKAKGFTIKGPNPLNGKGSYFNPNTGTRYYLDKGGMYKKGFEGPHIDIWYNNHPSFEKIKYFLDGSPKMYTPYK